MNQKISKITRIITFTLLIIGLITTVFGFFNGGLKDTNITLMIGLGFCVATMFIAMIFSFMNLALGTQKI